MTPPDTNLRKQKRRHWPVIWGILGATALAVLAWLVVSLFSDDVDETTTIDETVEPTIEGAETSGSD